MCCHFLCELPSRITFVRVLAALAVLAESKGALNIIDSTNLCQPIYNICVYICKIVRVCVYMCKYVCPYDIWNRLKICVLLGKRMFLEFYTSMTKLFIVEEKKYLDTIFSYSQ